MTVGELIEQLKNYPKDKTVYILAYNCCEFENVEQVGFSVENDVVITS